MKAADKSIPREYIEKRKSVVEFLMSTHNSDTAFDRVVTATLREELSFLKAILGQE